MAFRERRSGVSFGFIFSSVSWLLVFFFRCADEEFHQSGGEVLALLLRIFCVRHIVERQVHLRRELLYRSLHLSPPWGFMQRSIIAIGGKGQTREQVAQLHEGFYRNQRRAE